MIAAVALTLRRIRRVPASTRGSAPTSSATITTPVTASAGWHSTLAAGHWIALTHGGPPVATLRLVPVRPSWAWATHGRLVGGRIAGHRATGSRVRSTLRSHGRRPAVLREAVSWGDLRGVSGRLRRLRRVAVKLSRGRTIFAPLVIHS